MVTKCDLVAGFTEYFDDLPQEGRAQVWGVTFPYEQTLSGEAAEAFPAEFEALMARLNARLFARVEEERDVRRRTAGSSPFLSRWPRCATSSAQFVGEVFASTQFDQQILLRGVYFTSGTQDGTPIDRLLGAHRPAVRRRAGRRGAADRAGQGLLRRTAAQGSADRRIGARRRQPPPEVRERRPCSSAPTPRWRLSRVVGFIALSVSYSRNRAYIDETAVRGRCCATLAAGPRGRLGAARSVVAASRTPCARSSIRRTAIGTTRPWGDALGALSGQVGRQLPRATPTCASWTASCCRVFAARVKARLIDYAAQPEKLYDYLKAYLMLGDPKHLDKKHLQFVADLEWQSRDRRPREGAALATHFQSLLEYARDAAPDRRSIRRWSRARKHCSAGLHSANHVRGHQAGVCIGHPSRRPARCRGGCQRREGAQAQKRRESFSADPKHLWTCGVQRGDGHPHGDPGERVRPG